MLLRIGGTVRATKLERLVDAASVAFDQLEAKALRTEAARQNETIADLRARLDELRRLKQTSP